jgi:hypothetical protein
MYKLTRLQLTKSLNNVKKYINNHKKKGKKSSIHNSIKKIIRNNEYKLDWNRSLNMLNKKHIFFMECNKNIPTHWAETDGVDIWLSPLKNWTEENLYYTLLHECLHGLIKRKLYNSFVSEYLEHKFMLDFDKKLI